MPADRQPARRDPQPDGFTMRKKIFEAQALSMTTIQVRLYRLFVGLGPTRSLPALHQIAQEAGISATPRMIRRWNAKFKWTALAKETQAQVAVQLIDEMKEELIDMTRDDLKAIQKAKRRFIDRLNLDPDNPNLNDTQKEQALRFGLNDYVNLVKLERLILGDSTTRTETVIKIDSQLSWPTLRDHLMLMICSTQVR
jgi:hypothetical protein